MADKKLTANLGVLEKDAQELAKQLVQLGQVHMFEGWSKPGTNDTDKQAMFAQLLAANAAYPGGLKAYITKATKLLKDARDGKNNPFDGFKASNPEGEKLVFGDERFAKLEEVGGGELAGMGFVLVAGGLGERLGYNGIKVGLPTEISGGLCYLGSYIRSILAMQAKAGGAQLPLAIMTSDDTDAQTRDLLAANANFGMAEGQITVLKQELVPAMSDNDAKFAMKDPYSVCMKPHGHGDVHVLMNSSGLAAKWAESGVKWILFFQDTNGLVMRAVPSALGVSVENDYAMNTVTVPRRPGQAMGAITRLKKDKEVVTVNVEYNQLDALLKGSGGDKAGKDGFSPYPGNTNVFIVKADTYAAVLEKSQGLMPEFVNPKYANDERTKFKSPTRIECMMQDYPRLLAATDKVGITQTERSLAYNPVKNNVADAAAKQKSTGAAESAASGEAALYAANRRYLRSANAGVPEDGSRNFAGIECPWGAKVSLSPEMGVTLADLQNRVQGNVKMTERSTLVLDGDITLGNVSLDGALIVRAAPGCKVTLANMTVANEGWATVDVDPNDEKQPEELRIRGFTNDKRNDLNCKFDRPNVYVIDDTNPAPQFSSTKARKKNFDERTNSKSAYITFSKGYFKS